jgi:mRNA interferase RelE/StbE
MSSSATLSERLWAEFRALPPDSRDQFLLRLVGDHTVREEIEELLDFEIAEQRAQEPTRPLRDVLDDLES